MKLIFDKALRDIAEYLMQSVIIKTFLLQKLIKTGEYL